MEDSISRDFKGIWIPKEIWLSEDITIQEKLFYVEIDSLDNNNGCFATNRYFANFFNISITRASLVIKSLITKGYIKSHIIYKEGTKQILKRVLNICYRPYLTKVKDPIKQKLKDNNTTNNIINNITNKEKINKKKNENDKREDMFNKLWILYGRIGSKTQAKKKYLSKSFKYTDKEIKIAISRYLPMVEDTKYQKHFLTFLNNIDDFLKDYEEMPLKKHTSKNRLKLPSEYIQERMEKNNAIDVEVL